MRGYTTGQTKGYLEGKEKEGYIAKNKEKHMEEGHNLQRKDI